MKRRGIYQLELVAALTLISSMCLVAILAVLGMEHSQMAADDWKPYGGGVQSVPARPPDSIHYVGIAAGGCAAANCHGGQSDNDQPGNEWRTAAFDFLQYDPHAQAYNVLFEERSRNMIDRLARWEATPDGGQPAEQGVRGIKWYIEQVQNNCVSCHATPLPKDEPARPDGTLNHYALGVTCEACHGPASRWGDEHLGSRWQTNAQAEIENPIDKKGTGFNELENLSVAAATCAKCHIGNGEQIDGKSYREVTHDLVAAGHPRLDFDFAAWYASMPAHWNREREKQPEFNTIAWWVGEAAALATREQLISARIGTDQGSKKIEEPPRQPWPELANFDCYACHQALRFPPRSPSAEMPFVVSGSGGQLSVSQLPVPFGSSWMAYEHVNPEVKLANQRITELLVLSRKTGEVISGSTTPSSHNVAERLASSGEGGALRSFDELRSWYYAADAVSRDAAFAAQSSPDLQDAAKTMKTSLEALKAEMERYLARDGEVSRYVSPRGFGVAKVNAGDSEKPDPQAVQMAFDKAKQALQELAEKWSL